MCLITPATLEDSFSYLCFLSGLGVCSGINLWFNTLLYLIKRYRRKLNDDTMQKVIRCMGIRIDIRLHWSDFNNSFYPHTFDSVKYVQQNLKAYSSPIGIFILSIGIIVIYQTFTAFLQTNTAAPTSTVARQRRWGNSTEKILKTKVGPSGYLPWRLSGKAKRGVWNWEYASGSG